MARGETYQAAAAALDEDTREYLSEDEGEDFSFPEFTEDWGNVIVVDNLPKIPVAKYDKLLGVLKRIFAQTGTINTIEMPAENETTLGVAFVEFETAEEAQKAIRLTDGYALDKSHVFKVNSFDEAKRLGSLQEQYTPPAKPNLCPDSIPVHGSETPCTATSSPSATTTRRRSSGAKAVGPPTLEYGGEREKEGGLYWCEQYVKWSPQGSMLATFHNKGIALWGDSDFNKQGRFAHNNGVKRLDFSPGENYMITANDHSGDKRGVVVWDLRTRRELRTFEVASLPVPPPILPAGEDPGPVRYEPAHFKWSHDDSYVARRGKDKNGFDIVFYI